MFRDFPRVLRFFMTAALCVAAGLAPALALEYKSLGDREVEVVPFGVSLSLPLYFQPDFEHPRRFSVEDMEILAQETFARFARQNGFAFNRNDPHHVFLLAEFFHLTPVDELDPYSAPMEESDIRYFTEIEVHQDSELYPVEPSQLAIRFYWESLARLAAAYFRIEIVSERFGRRPEKTRGKVSDIATAGMFDKIRGMTLLEVEDTNKERYDVSLLIKQLRDKGRAVR
jgi:hypothetical protein